MAGRRTNLRQCLETYNKSLALHKERMGGLYATLGKIQRFNFYKFLYSAQINFMLSKVAVIILSSQGFKFDKDRTQCKSRLTYRQHRVVYQLFEQEYCAKKTKEVDFLHRDYEKEIPLPKGFFYAVNIIKEKINRFQKETGEKYPREKLGDCKDGWSVQGAIVFETKGKVPDMICDGEYKQINGAMGILDGFPHYNGVEYSVEFYCDTENGKVFYTPDEKLFLADDKTYELYKKIVDELEYNYLKEIGRHKKFEEKLKKTIEESELSKYIIACEI